MYDMYRWNESEPGVDTARRHAPANDQQPESARGRRRRHAGRPSGHRARPDAHDPAAKALQHALDRRDNGGDSSGVRGQ